ncbi:MAG TPA: putative porin [Chitinophagaceae bacterium]
MQQVGGLGGGGSSDSLQARNKLEDSITIRFRYLDSSGNYKLDSSISDFTKRFPVPGTNIHLGNTGTASRSLLFSPVFNAGWDPGFHVFDAYKWKLEKVRFFNTTRPYSELNYMLASRSEQIIEVMHTQNIKPDWNFAFQYRFINSPGYFKNQKTNHNNYLFTSKFQTKNRRYNAYLVALANLLKSTENGGMEDDKNYLDDPIYKDRFTIPTKIGGDTQFETDFFNTRIGTGNKYNEFTFLLRQQFDLGKKDSLVTDSTVIPLFYPRLRFEHTIQYNRRKYLFEDFLADSAYYQDYYGQTLKASTDTFFLKDTWNELINDFSIYQFPDAKNLQQFIRLGAAVQNLSGTFANGSDKLYNVFGHAEYRNKTRNLKWDMIANGKLYFVGLNAGDFDVHASLQRFVSKKLGYLQVGFENAFRTPSFLYDSRSSFYLLPTNENFKKENNTHIYATISQPRSKLSLSGHYYLLTNYTYVTNYYELKQESSLFNVLQVALQKTINVGKRWILHTDIYFQKTIGDAPVNLPLIYTRNRFGYEGNFGFPNLDIAFGLEARYHTPYKADSYSPALGQFTYQDSITIDNLPQLDGYIHFRIRPFKLYFRAENLNTARMNGGFGFTNNNLTAPGYAMPGLVFRLGIWWSFVN